MTSMKKNVVAIVLAVAMAIGAFGVTAHALPAEPYLLNVTLNTSKSLPAMNVSPSVTKVYIKKDSLASSGKTLYFDGNVTMMHHSGSDWDWNNAYVSSGAMGYPIQKGCTFMLEGYYGTDESIVNPNKKVKMKKFLKIANDSQLGMTVIADETGEIFYMGLGS